MPIPALFRVFPSAKGESIGQIRRETVARGNGPRWSAERDARARRGARRPVRLPERESLQDTASGWSVSSFQQ